MLLSVGMVVSASTVNVNTFVSDDNVPFVIVAVKVTVAFPAPNAGLVTVPSVAITPGLLDAHVIVEPPKVPVLSSIKLLVILARASPEIGTPLEFLMNKL